MLSTRNIAWTLAVETRQRKNTAAQRDLQVVSGIHIISCPERFSYNMLRACIGYGPLCSPGVRDKHILQVCPTALTVFVYAPVTFRGCQKIYIVRGGVWLPLLSSIHFSRLRNSRDDCTAMETTTTTTAIKTNNNCTVYTVSACPPLEVALGVEVALGPKMPVLQPGDQSRP